MAQALSDNQIRHLQALLRGKRGAYPGLNMGTLASLAKRKLVRAEYGRGSISMPHTSIKWQLTEAGRQEISDTLCRADGQPITECKGATCKSHGRCCWQ